MNTRTSPLQKRDLAVFALCAAFLAATLGAVGETGRRRAKESVCQANLHQWHRIFQDYIEENNGKFLTGVNDRGYWWPVQLAHEYQDWKRNRTWFCPTATIPVVNNQGTSSPTLSIFNAWGVFRPATPMTYNGAIYTITSNGLSGSFGLNGYVIPIPENKSAWAVNTYEGGVPSTEGWRNLLDVPDASRVPMLLDALRFDLWPRFTDAPAESQFASWTGNHMARCCINRHEGAVNCLFVDGSVRKVGLKELWTLKWHRSFDTAGPWTKAGGVQPEDWPAWIRPFKDY